MVFLSQEVAERRTRQPSAGVLADERTIFKGSPEVPSPTIRDVLSDGTTFYDVPVRDGIVR